MQLHSQIGDRQGRVMICDDEEQVRKPMRYHLTKAGYEVLEVTDGEEAIKAMKEGDNALMVDTIITDMRMPKVNGQEVVAYFREQFPTIPVVVLTGFPDVELAVNLMKQGVIDYIVKPVEKENLLRVVRHTTQQHEILRGQFTT